MLVTIALLSLMVAIVVSVGIAFYCIRILSQTFKTMSDNNKAIGEMLMAGSYQEYNRIQQGKPPQPNSIKEEDNFPQLDEDKRIPFDEITGIKIDDGPKREIKLYS